MNEDVKTKVFASFFFLQKPKVCFVGNAALCVPFFGKCNFPLCTFIFSKQQIGSSW